MSVLSMVPIAVTSLHVDREGGGGHSTGKRERGLSNSLSKSVGRRRESGRELGAGGRIVLVDKHKELVL